MAPIKVSGDDGVGGGGWAILPSSTRSTADDASAKSEHQCKINWRVERPKNYGDVNGSSAWFVARLATNHMPENPHTRTKSDSDEIGIHFFLLLFRPFPASFMMLRSYCSHLSFSPFDCLFIRAWISASAWYFSTLSQHKNHSAHRHAAYGIHSEAQLRRWDKKKWQLAHLLLVGKFNVIALIFNLAKSRPA